MNEKEQIKWHKIIQDILDKYLSLMSGKITEGPGREQQRYIRVDYSCKTFEEVKEPQEKKNLALPFDHLFPNGYHIIEFKSLWEVLNETTFREYVGRALIFQNAGHKEEYLDRMTLTILTTRKPESLIKTGLYAIEQVNDWKYKSLCFPRIEISILVIKGMRDKKEGEALALLQILDPESWPGVFSQNLDNTKVLENIAQEINKEVYMNLVEEVKRKGITEGMAKKAREVVSNMLMKGMEIPMIAEITGLSEKEILVIKQELIRH